MQWRSQSRGASLAALLVVLSPGPRAACQGPPPQAVRVDPVRLESVQEKRRVTGEIRAVRRSRIAAEEPGLVVKLPVLEGQRVEKGTVLAELDAARLNIEIEGLEASLKVANATLDERKADAELKQRDQESLEKLFKRGASNPKELADAKSAARIAHIRVAQAELQISVIQSRADLLSRRLQDTVIRAPFSGAVVAKYTELGEWISEGEAVVELVSVDAVEAWLAVPQRYLAALHAPGLTLTLKIEATGQMITTRKFRRIPHVDSSARVFALAVPLEKSDAPLVPGMSLVAWVPTGERSEQLTVSKDAVLRNDGGPYLYVARGTLGERPGQAVPVPVQVLFSHGERWVIQCDALKPGELVVVEGNERLFPMMPVMPIRASAAQEPSEKIVPAATQKPKGQEQ
ncbi:MAG: efflux RND transporter periplasmic adaptor subunit [Planctomycetota bacterium]